MMDMVILGIIILLLGGYLVYALVHPEEFQTRREEIIMLQIILTILIYLILVIPVGIYVYHIAAGKHTFADPVFDRVDGVIYKLGGVNPKNGMSWKNTLCH